MNKLSSSKFLISGLILAAAPMFANTVAGNIYVAQCAVQAALGCPGVWVGLGIAVGYLVGLTFPLSYSGSIKRHLRSGCSAIATLNTH